MHFSYYIQIWVNCLVTGFRAAGFSDQIAERGERLELLVDKTEDLSAHVRF